MKNRVLVLGVLALLVSSFASHAQADRRRQRIVLGAPLMILQADSDPACFARWVKGVKTGRS